MICRRGMKHLKGLRKEGDKFLGSVYTTGDKAHGLGLATEPSTVASDSQWEHLGLVTHQPRNESGGKRK